MRPGCKVQLYSCFVFVFFLVGEEAAVNQIAKIAHQKNKPKKKI